MEGIVEAEAPDSPGLRQGERCEKQADVEDLVSDLMLSKYIAGYDPGLLGLRDVGYTPREDGVAVVGSAISRDEADESL